MVDTHKMRVLGVPTKLNNYIFHNIIVSIIVLLSQRIIII